MKKLIAIFSMLVLTSAIFAQSPISKGSLTLGGNISYYDQTLDDTDASQSVFNFNPQIGYFFADNLYTAVSISYLHYSSGGTSLDQIGIGPAFRYYFEAGKIKPFLGGSYTYFESTNNTSDDKTTSSEFKLSGGADFFVSRGLAIEGSINYSFIDNNYSSSDYENNLSMKKFEIAIGVNYFIF